VTVTTTRTEVAVSVEDEGPGLPESQRGLLETGDIEEFDNPRMGFGLNVVRLLVEGYGGAIETDVGESGTAITVRLPRAEAAAAGQGPTRSELAGIRPAIPHLVVALAAALVAGVPYGIASELLGGSVAAIGVFYGTPNPVVGWLTHEFHSVVFGFVFVGLVSVALERYRDALLTYVAVGVGWALVLWIGAASVVGPVWLRLLGISAPVPSFSVPLLVSHLAWGITLSLLVALGYRYAAPWLTRLGERLRGATALAGNGEHRQ